MDYIIHLFNDRTGMLSTPRLVPGYKTTIAIDGCGVSEGVLGLDFGTHGKKYAITNGSVILPCEAWAGDDVEITVTAKAGGMTHHWSCGRYRRLGAGAYTADEISGREALIAAKTGLDELQSELERTRGALKKIQGQLKAKFTAGGTPE